MLALDTSGGRCFIRLSADKTAADILQRVVSLSQGLQVSFARRNKYCRYFLKASNMVTRKGAAAALVIKARNGVLSGEYVAASKALLIGTVGAIWNAANNREHTSALVSDRSAPVIA